MQHHEMSVLRAGDGAREASKPRRIVLSAGGGRLTEAVYPAGNGKAQGSLFAAICAEMVGGLSGGADLQVLL